uniref:EGF-like domain-containing protein n=1 Tax=Oryzias melastigma TaxID=30732 RepID=A0A3B3BST8_ORYME
MRKTFDPSPRERYIDECSAGSAQCSHACVNTVGSFRCVCHPGFEYSSDVPSFLQIVKIQLRHKKCVILSNVRIYIFIMLTLTN